MEPKTKINELKKDNIIVHGTPKAKAKAKAKAKPKPKPKAKAKPKAQIVQSAESQTISVSAAISQICKKMTKVKFYAIVRESSVINADTNKIEKVNFVNYIRPQNIAYNKEALECFLKFFKLQYTKKLYGDQNFEATIFAKKFHMFINGLKKTKNVTNKKNIISTISVIDVLIECGKMTITNKQRSGITKHSTLQALIYFFDHMDTEINNVLNS